MNLSLGLSAALVALTLAACGGDDAAQNADASKGAASDAAAVPATAAATAADAAKVFKVKSGIIESTIEMMGNQKQTLYFDDYGAKQAIVTDVDVMGMKSQQVVITADGWKYEYDAGKKEGTKTKQMTPPSLPGGVPDLDDITDAMKAQFKMKDIEGRTIAGKDAKGYQIELMADMPMKVWVWEGIPLRTEMKLGKDAPKPMVTEVANLQLDIDVPADRFTVPADVKLTEM
jgi:hypothetical protein